MSMLYCSAIQQVADLDDDSLELLDTDGINEESLDFLQDVNDRCEILIQWIQSMIVEAQKTGLIDIPAPILSRVFQELSQGIVNLNNVRKIKDVQFPFPYEQMITVMLLVYTAVTPVLASQAINSIWCAAGMCFFSVGAYWSLVYIAREIDQPFGSDANDLPVKFMQIDFNRSLLELLDTRAQTPPTYVFNPDLMSATATKNCRSSASVLKSTRKRKRKSMELNLTARTSPIVAEEHSNSSSPLSGPKMSPGPSGTNSWAPGLPLSRQDLNLDRLGLDTDARVSQFSHGSHGASSRLNGSEASSGHQSYFKNSSSGASAVQSQTNSSTGQQNGIDSDLAADIEAQRNFEASLLYQQTFRTLI